MTTNVHDNQELFKVTIDGVETWRVDFTVNGVRYQRSIAPCLGMSKEQARDALDMLKMAATPTVQIEDIRLCELIELWQEYYRSKQVTPGRYQWVNTLIQRFMLPAFGNRLTRSIQAAELLPFFRQLEKTQAKSIASCTRQYMSQIFRYGIIAGKADQDPAGALRYIIIRPPAVNHATILQPRKIGKLMRDIDCIPSLETRLRVQLQAYTFTRSGECTKATWDEIDFSRQTWSIPAERMKMKRPYIVPLVPQTLQILRRLKKEFGGTQWLFPAVQKKEKTAPMNITTPLRAIRALGYGKNEFCLHGFRAMAASTLSESGKFPTDAIERQLAHVERNKIRLAYVRSEYLQIRRDIMIWWANWLDSVKMQI